jgi:pimeloyl-ACP methyl ester carboxylesterase
VVAPDLLGHGQSAKPRAIIRWGVRGVLRDLLDELGITPMRPQPVAFPL